MKAGKLVRFDYEYARAGTASVWVASDPRTGTRVVETRRQRTKADDCRFHQRGAAVLPHADKSVLGHDTLNTHQAGACYAPLPPAEAVALAQRFEVHFTPKKGAWLHIAERELSALSRLC